MYVTSIRGDATNPSKSASSSDIKDSLQMMQGRAAE